MLPTFLLLTSSTGTFLRVDGPGGTRRQFDAWGDDSIRARVVPAKGIFVQPLVGGLLPQAPLISTETTSTVSTMTNGNLMVSVDATSGLATYTRVSDGKVMLQETSVAIAPPTERGASDTAVPTGRASVTFAGLEGSEGYYGFGEHRGSSRCDNQCVNTSLPIRNWDWNIQNSVNVKALPNNGNAWVPFYSSSKGYAFLSNSAGYGTVHVGVDAVAWNVFATRQLDFWVTTSSAPKPATPSATLSASPPPPPPPYRDVLEVSWFYLPL